MKNTDVHCKESIIKSVVMVSGIAIVSKVIGFAKSMIQAFYFGSTLETDAFNMAYGVVADVIYMFTTAIAVAFVPLYVQKKCNDGNQKTFIDTSRIVTALGVFSVIGIILLEIGAGLVFRIIAPTYSGEQFDNTVFFFRIMVFGVFFALETNLFQNILNSERQYGYSSVTSIINSVVLILFIVLGYHTIDIYSLVIAVPISFFIQWICLYIKGKKYGRISFRYGVWDESVRLLILQAIPILLSNATVEINQAVDRALLTTVEVGAVTAVTYSEVLFQFVSNIIGVPISSVMFTELSEAGAKNDYYSVQNAISKTFNLIVLICIPILIIILFYANSIVRIVYGHGNFSETAIEQTAVGLFFYSICIIPVALKQVVTKAFYALNESKIPMLIGIFEVGMNIILSILWAKKGGVAGIVGATAAASVTFVIILIIAFSKKYVVVFSNVQLGSYIKIFIACLICVIGTFTLRDVVVVSDLFLDFCLKTVISMVIYFGTLILIKENTMRKIWRKKIEVDK